MNRVLEAMRYGIDQIVLPQTIGRSLTMKPVDKVPGRDRTYDDSQLFWRDLLSERVRAEQSVKLNRMRLFEWFPRNPGLYHTEQASRARNEAANHIRHIEERDYDAFRENADAPPDHASLIRTLTAGTTPTRTQIFTPQGKLSMLHGGIGCVRMQPVILEDGSRSWFMSATSSTSPDEGIPILVPNHLYQRFIDRIIENGFATVTLYGHTRFIPKEYTDLSARSAGIPRLYVEIDEIEDAGQDEDYGLVSVAASFLAELNGTASIHAAYVTFDPGHAGARASATRWLREEYVEGYYSGRLLTDFDQQCPTISDTLFSLNEVLTSPDLASAIQRLSEFKGYFDWEMLKENNFSFHTHREFVRMKVEANNNSGAMIIGEKVTGNQLTVSHSDLGRLKEELSRLIEELRKEPASDERDRAVGALLDARDAADDGNSAIATSSLQRLKPVGNKILEIGEKVGVGLAVAAIKSAIGF